MKNQSPLALALILGMFVSGLAGSTASWAKEPPESQTEPAPASPGTTVPPQGTDITLVVFTRAGTHEILSPIRGSDSGFASRPRRCRGQRLPIRSDTV